MGGNRVEQVTADEVLPINRRHVLDALMQLYLHDFSEHASLGTSHGEIGEDGRFTYRWLDAYWQKPGRVPLLVRADGRIAGFVLVNQWSALDRPLDHARRHACGTSGVPPYARALGSARSKLQSWSAGVLA
jgi:hypothetical protein